MDRLILACVPADTPLLEALKKIRPNTRAVVVRRSDRSLLVTAGDIMSLCNDLVDLGADLSKATVGIIRPVQTSVVPKSPMPAGLASMRGMAPEMKKAEQKHFDAAFKERNDGRYSIQETSDDEALVVTASELFKGQLNRSYTRCTCVGDPVHSFEQEDLEVPGKCNKPHGVDVSCETVSGL
jgi:hypothetical protein